MSYATTEDVTAFIGSTAPADSTRLIERASEILDMVTFNKLNDTNLIPTSVLAKWNEAMKKAVCAQIEFWISTDESIAITGSFDSFSAGDISMSGKLPQLAPRAKIILFNAGLLNSGIGTSFKTCYDSGN